MRWLFSLVALLLLAAFALWFLDGRRGPASLPAQHSSAPAAAPAVDSARIEGPTERDAGRATAAAADAIAPPPAAPASAIPALTLRGRCVDSQGSPLPGVVVSCWIYYWAANSADLPFTRDYATFDTGAAPRTECDAQGRFELQIPPEKGGEAAAWQLRLRCEAAGRALIGVSIELERGGSADTGDVVLPLGARLSGRVTDTHGTPVADARVSASGPNPKPDRGTRSRVEHWGGGARCAADGSFVIESAAPGQLALDAWTEDRRHSKSISLFVEEGVGQEGLELVVPALDDPNSISGIVVSAAGEPQPRALLRLSGTFGSSRTSVSSRADSKGGFRIEFAGQDGHLTAEDPDGKLGFANLDGLQPGMHDLRLVLGAPRLLALRVLDAAGPVASFGWSLRVQSAPNSYSLSTPEPEKPRAEGRAELNAPPDPFWVEVRATGYGALELGPFQSEALPAQALFRLEPSPGIRGLVVRDGKPLAGAQVKLWRAPAPDREAHVDNLPSRMLPYTPPVQVESAADGSFLLAVDRPGKYYVRASAKGHPGVVSEVIDYAPSSGISGLVLTLHSGGAIEGRAFDADGAPRAGLWIVVTDGWPPAASAKTDERGAFRFEHLAPGAYAVFDAEGPIASEPRGWSESSRQNEPGLLYDCTVRDDETTHYDLRAPEPAELVLTLSPALAGLGSWSGGAGLEARGRTLEGIPRWNDTRDELHLSFPASGHCGLFLNLVSEQVARDGVSISGDFDLRPGRNAQSLDFAVGRVRATLAPGKPPRSWVFLQATLRPGWEFYARVQADESGHAEFPCVPVGKCQLSCEPSPALREVELKPGETLEVENL